LAADLLRERLGLLVEHQEHELRLAAAFVDEVDDLCDTTTCYSF
jgi:hypothetical protein